VIGPVVGVLNCDRSRGGWGLTLVGHLVRVLKCDFSVGGRCLTVFGHMVGGLTVISRVVVGAYL